MIVDLPIPFCPSKPSTVPSFNVGSPNNSKLFGPYLCVGSSRASGRFMTFTAPKMHLLVQIPHPEHNSSEITGFLLFSSITMVSSSIRTPGQ